MQTRTCNFVHSLSFVVWTWCKIRWSRVLLILHLQTSPTAIHLYCPHSLYFVFKMHSKSDNLGYLKDQNKVKFPGGFAPWTPTLDPQGMAQSPAPTPPPPKPSSSKVLASLAVTYLFFSRLTLCVWWHVCFFSTQKEGIKRASSR